ncbi:predicted protein [Sclerotinia sclerotiorum 1980 UF-70]|uniref:Transmembrane protein n=2 Tax=Sclerotinia sclerotiorum (strain ATCC 18683 / 1980 / Ss-1) TaxID=665079 RepID=A0A1D9Q958_SCLS1|nr:predicted protein [Sclerotinia sclerotiorum 1980 UF-70]APA11471.1 hypothetical protein sscle_08g062410 [Sclerotinia sclerotiorum 1980 UF-70]EDO02399.1 predicted protein [Sclerotinia sclerotiorum 1980 UF-70]
MIFSRLTNSRARILLSLLIFGLIVSTQAEPRTKKSSSPEPSQSTITWTSAAATITSGVDECCFSGLCRADQDRCYGYHHRIDSNKSGGNITKKKIFWAVYVASTFFGILGGLGLMFL